MSRNLMEAEPVIFLIGENLRKTQKMLKNFDGIKDSSKNFLQKSLLSTPRGKNKESIYQQQLLKELFVDESDIRKEINMGGQPMPVDKGSWDEYQKIFNEQCREFFIENTKKEIKKENKEREEFVEEIFKVLDKGGVIKTNFETVILEIKKEVRENMDRLISLIHEAVMTGDDTKIINGFKSTGKDFAEECKHFLENIFEINKKSIILENSNLKEKKYFNEWEWLANEFYKKEATLGEKEYVELVKEYSELKTVNEVSNMKGLFYEFFMQHIVFKELSREGQKRLKFKDNQLEKDFGEGPVDATYKKVGFQLKHGTSFSKEVSSLYLKDNFNLELSNINSYRFLEMQDWQQLTMFLQLNAYPNGFIKGKIDKYIYPYLLKIEEYLLRIKTNEAFKAEEMALKNHVFVINNTFYPASYVLHNRFLRYTQSWNKLNMVKKISINGTLIFPSPKDNKGISSKEMNFEGMKNLLSDIIIKR